MSVDDDTRLRFLQAQRRSFNDEQDQDGSAFVPDDIDAELGLFGRLKDDEAFDDWLQMGIPTTVESTFNDRAPELSRDVEPGNQARSPTIPDTEGDTWSAFRSTLANRMALKKTVDQQATVVRETSMSEAAPAHVVRSIPARGAFSDALHSVRTEMSASEHRVRETCLSFGIPDLHSYSVQLVAAAHILSANEPQPEPCVAGNIPNEFGQEYEASSDLRQTSSQLVECGMRLSHLLYELEATASAGSDFLNGQTAHSADDARGREELLAELVVYVDEQRQACDRALEVDLLLRLHDMFQKERPLWIDRVNSASLELFNALKEATETSFENRRDAFDAEEDKLILKCAELVGMCGALLRRPFGIPVHSAWQHALVTASYDVLGSVAAVAVSLSHSELHVGCSSLRAASRIKTLALQGCSFATIAHRQIRDESARVGFNLCVAARYLLGELDGVFDKEWGFTYM
jgi:hypothetical protein